MEHNTAKTTTYFLQMLLKFDDMNAFETPSDKAPLLTLAQEVKQLQLVLQETFDLPFKLTIVQDAAFYGSLSIIQEQQSFAIRISNFAKLTTLYSQPEDYLGNFPIHAIVSQLETLKFIYIPFEILKMAYTGINAQLPLITGKANPTWWDRYFDYI